jgi:hypothetical protein
MVVVAGCTTELSGKIDRDPATVEDDSPYLDLTKDHPPAPEGGIEIRTPVFEIPPYTESLKCFFGTYDGPTVGATFMMPLQADQYSHHNQLKTVPADEDWPDGTLIDCVDGGDMSRYVPLFEAVGIEADDDVETGNWLDMPDGVAMRLAGGQKWVLDMHYINLTDKILLVNNGVNIDFVPEEEVTSWASSMQFDAGPPSIPPGEEVETKFQCAFRSDGYLLSMLGHMHARGTQYSVDAIQPDGSRNRIYEVDEWEGDYHPYFPHIVNWAPGEYAVQEGDVLETTCNWYNYTDQHLGFPEEMCTTVIVMYPLESPVICIDGEYVDLGDGATGETR